MGKNTIFGPYELLSRLHAGGIAEVFRAIDTRTGSPCALKRILPFVAEDEELMKMLEDEARIASRLDHPCIARVHDFGVIEGTHYIAYELVDGVDLRVVFENASLASEPPPLGFLLYVFTQIAEALAYADSHGVVHRDVSPHNIVVSLDGDVKLIDFGIAKAKGQVSRTGAGVIKGKLGYMSPEQVRGGSHDPIDHRSDLFSLGICMWELLTLKRLFSATNEILVLDMVKNHVPEPPSTHRAEGRSKLADLDRIVLKALAKNHGERYRSARQLTKDLEAFVGFSGALSARADIARTMRQTFGSGPGNAQRSTGSIMELQETRMSDDNKSGSDLDIFEGLGKKSSARTSAAPPPPPSSQLAAAPPAPANNDLKKTLMGIPMPAQPPSQASLQSAPPAAPTSTGRISAPPPLPPGAGSSPPSGHMRAASPSAPPAPTASKPPPPPGRGSLPNLSSGPPGPPSGPQSTPSQSNMTAAQQQYPSQSPSATQKVTSQVPPPVSTRPGPAALSQGPASGLMAAVQAQAAATASAAPPAPATAPGSQPNGGKLDMDWDDDDEATHVFDKDKESGNHPAAAPAAGPESRRPEHASMDDILSSPRPSSQAPAAGTPPPPPAHTATLSGAFGALGQPREAVNGSGPPSQNGPTSSQFRSGPPPSQSIRSAPPPPPGSMRPYNPSTSTAPIPPPPPPGQVTTAPMHMPMRNPASVPPPPSGHPSGHHGPHGSVPPHQQHISGPPPQHISQPPQHQQHISQAPMPQMPPVSRNMEATSIVPRAQQGSNAGIWVALLLGVVAAVGIAVFFLMPRSGTLVVNVADSKGAAVTKQLEIQVDGKKACESAPCIVKDISAGVHEVKVTAAGFDPPAPRAITIESRKDTSTDFSLSAGKTAGGTGLKVAGNPLQSGVRLMVDGKEYGPLPQELHDLTAGQHTVKIVGSERYAAFEKTVDIKGDDLTDLGTVALKVLKGKATIQLGTPGAKVYLVSGTNRKEVPQFPIAIDFDPNEKWNLEAKMLGMDDYSQPINFDDGQAEKTIVVSLTPKGSAPVAVAPPPVTFRAPPSGGLPPPGGLVAPAPKEPVVKAPPEPKEPVAAKEPAAKKEPPAAAAPGGECFLNINSRPASTVLLDGKPLGPTPRVKVPVSAGTHTVLFVNAEESLKKSVSVTVAAGETKAVSAKLRD